MRYELLLFILNKLESISVDGIKVSDISPIQNLAIKIGFLLQMVEMVGGG